MKKIDWKNIPLSHWIKGALSTICYLLLVVWVGNPWLLLGTPIVFDVYITRIIPWGFWKHRKDGRKPSIWIEWIDAIVFALVAVYLINLFLFQNYKIPTSSLEKSLLVGDHLFVSKVSYGPRMPNAPISMPLTQNTLPILNCKSYLEWPMWGYKRLAGLGKVERNDIVVFNFPAGDTVIVDITNPDYYSTLIDAGLQQLVHKSEQSKNLTWQNSWERNHKISQLGREMIFAQQDALGGIVWRPVDKRDCYVKRCIALPGDTLEIRHNVIYINGVEQQNPKDVQHKYLVRTNGQMLGNRFFETLGISDEDKMMAGVGPTYTLPLTEEMVEKVKAMPYIESVEIEEEAPDASGMSVFPRSTDYPWSRDNYGPIWMPRRGAAVSLTPQNALLYERIITAYEGHTLDVIDGKVLIDGSVATEYVFGMDYYFMLGDNRHKSADSRYWGFVPEDHIVGKPILVWLSINPNQYGSSIRWDRFFKFVHE